MFSKENAQVIEFQRKIINFIKEFKERKGDTKTSLNSNKITDWGPRKYKYTAEWNDEDNQDLKIIQ